MNFLRRGGNAVARVSRRSMATFEEEASESRHAQQTLGFYRNLSLFIAIPACAVVAYKAFVMTPEPEAPAFLEWSHLRKRAKKFPWGDGNHSLIHNPHMNPLPDGFEGHH